MADGRKALNYSTLTVLPWLENLQGNSAYIFAPNKQLAGLALMLFIMYHTHCVSFYISVSALLLILLVTYVG